MLTSESLDPANIIADADAQAPAQLEPAATARPSPSSSPNPVPSGATAATPSLVSRFDRSDYRGRLAAIRPSEPNESPGASADANSGGTPEGLVGDALIAADYLRSLGWPRQKIERLFLGPKSVSIHEIAGREVDASPIPAAEAEAIPEVEGTVDRLPFAKDNKSNTTQREIVDAVWLNLHGDPSKLVGIADLITELPGELQAYLLAALYAGVEAMPGLSEWKQKFEADQRGRSQALPPRQRTQEAFVGSVLSAAASAARKIPIGGPAISEVLLAGIALQEALLFGMPQPIRDASEQELACTEGTDAARGLAAAEGESQADLMKRLLSDDIAKRLPKPAEGATYPFVPSLDQFQSAARRLELYPDQDNAIGT